MPAPSEHKEQRRFHLQSFIRALHVLDVSVKKHVDELELDETFIENEERRLGDADFLSDADKKKLKEILEDIRKAVEHIEKMEDYLENSVSAMVVRTHAPLELDFMRTSKDLYELSNTMVKTIKHEHDILYLGYVETLDRLEKSFKDLISIEQRHLSDPDRFKRRFVRINHRMRTIIIEAIKHVTRDIIKLYDKRIRYADSLIKKAKKHEPGLVAVLLKRHHQFEIIKSGYSALASNHYYKIAEMYENAVTKSEEREKKKVGAAV